jgi:hypothetical protein
LKIYIINTMTSIDQTVEEMQMEINALSYQLDEATKQKQQLQHTLNLFVENPDNKFLIENYKIILEKSELLNRENQLKELILTTYQEIGNPTIYCYGGLFTRRRENKSNCVQLSREYLYVPNTLRGTSFYWYIENIQDTIRFDYSDRTQMKIVIGLLQIEKYFKELEEIKKKLVLCNEVNVIFIK